MYPRFPADGAAASTTVVMYIIPLKSAESVVFHFASGSAGPGVECIVGPAGVSVVAWF